MAIRFVEIKAADNEDALNTEWVVLKNEGKSAFNLRGCGMTVGKRGSAKKSLLGIIDPGFILAPGQQMRMCTGNPATEKHGTPPAETDELKNYFLFLPKTYVAGTGTVLTLVLRGLPVSKGEYDAAAAGGVLAAPAKS